LRFELASLKFHHLLIAISLQLLTNLMCDSAGLPSTDAHLGKVFQGVGSLLKRRLTDAGTHEGSCRESTG
jgi:hypothetical protein